MEFAYFTSVKLIMGFFILYLSVRILGGKLIDKITPFHFISAVVLGELLGNAVYEKSVSVWHVITTVFLWGILLFIMEWIAQKSLFLRTLFEGKPKMIIREGRINYQQMKKSRMNLNQLQSQLRQDGIFSLREVAYAFIEPNGTISILKKASYQSPTVGELDMLTKPAHLPITLIRDGQVMEDNLNEMNKNHAWLKNQLFAHGIATERDVFFAEWLETDGLYIVRYT
ncbi:MULTISPECIES: DUF421 domain-containing protein [unclassified Virgibacillus]|uniref:DUF421 domain-containing protein n=1 Tax=unclassified Virgibacillus TaxID=2620237 RepID=UPI0024DE601D|nr:DUF421 domain-containing protein [Virgibacillus sp. LDC-1]